MPTRKAISLLTISAVILLILIGSAWLYGPGLEYPFFFDDYNSLMDDQGQVSPMIKDSGARLRELKQQFLRPDRGLTWLTFAFDYQRQKNAGQLRPAGFRYFNLLLHGGLAFLVYLTLLRLTAAFSGENRRNQPPDKYFPVAESGPKQLRVLLPCLAGTVFFLVHPLALNSVIYISQRFTMLAMFFYLVSFFAWSKARDTSGFSRPAGFAVAGLAFWAAIHAKEMALTLPLTIIFYELYRMPAGRLRGTTAKLIFAAAIVLILGMFIFFAIKIGLFNQSWINIGFRSDRLWSPAVQMVSEARAFWGYWLRLFMPMPGWLCLHHEFPPSPKFLDPAGLTALAAHAVVLITAWKARRKAPLAFFGIFWFYLVLGPPYLVLPQKELLVEYKTYMAAPGAAMLLCGLMQRLQAFYARRTATLLTALILIWLAGLSVVNLQRRPDFQSRLAIWNDVLKKYPESRRALNNRAVAHLKNRDPARALADLNRLTRSHPGYARGFENRGRLRFYLKDYRGAASDFRSAMKLLPADKPELEAARRELSKMLTAARQGTINEHKK